MRRIIAFMLLVSLAACDITPQGYKYQYGDLPDSPVNLEDFNTEYDDYNSTAPSLGRLIPFCFSTNRYNGETFDVIYMPMNINFDKSTGVLNVTNQYSNWSVFAEQYAVINNEAIPKIATPANELGPNLLVGYRFNDYYYTLMYATDVSGNYDINFITNRYERNFGEPQPIGFLNSDADDLYPAFTQDSTRLYFCSNRNNGQFDIFYTEVPTPNNYIEEFFADTTAHEIVTDTVLSSAYDDKCPYIFLDRLVFASNRPGGYGGYDLYYSMLTSAGWGEPVNFGPAINSSADEYRPIVFSSYVSYTESMMVFSSDRDGGKGGFDLYFVGIPGTPLMIE